MHSALRQALMRTPNGKSKIDHYREHWAYYGHKPKDAVVWKIVRYHPQQTHVHTEQGAGHAASALLCMYGAPQLVDCADAARLSMEWHHRP
jgi:hypothetical protein